MVFENNCRNSVSGPFNDFPAKIIKYNILWCKNDSICVYLSGKQSSSSVKIGSVQEIEALSEKKKFGSHSRLKRQFYFE